MKIEQLHSILMDIMYDIDDVCKKENIPYFLEAGSMLGAVRHGNIIPWDDDIDISVRPEDLARITQALRDHLPAHYRVVEQEEFSPYFYDFLVRVQDTRYHWHEPGEEDILLDNKQNYINVDIFTVSKCANTKLGTRLYILADKIIYGLAMAYKAKIHGESYTLLQKMQAAILSTVGKCIPLKKIHAMYRWLRDRNIGKQKKYCLVINDRMTYLHAGMESTWFDEAVDMPFGERRLPVPKGYHGYLTHNYGDYMQPPKDKSKYITHMEFDAE